MTASTITRPDEADTPLETPGQRTPLPVYPRHSRQGGYLAKKCFEQAAKDNMPKTYPADLKLPYSAFTQSLMASGNAFEDHIGSRVAAEALDPSAVRIITEARTPDGERTEEGKRQKETDTWLAYLDPSVRFIFNARMGGQFEQHVSEHFGRPISDIDRVSEPDAIELGPVMANGLRAMRFVDVKWHKVTSGKSVEPKSYPRSELSEPFFFDRHGDSVDLHGSLNSDDWMQLAHYYRHAQSLGLVDNDASLWGAVIGKEEFLVWAELDVRRFMRFDPVLGKRRMQSALEMYDRDFAEGLAIVDNALARDVDPTVKPLTFPEWKADCKECPWKDVCVQELTTAGDGGHITLLPGITPARAVPFYDIGVHDIGGLARLDPDGDVEGVKDLAPAVYQARVTKAQKVHRAPGVAFVDLPRAAIEIDFDYETADIVYQRGVRATGRRRKPNGDFRQRVEMHTFDDFSRTEAGEIRVFVAMWRYFQDMIALAKSRRHSIRFYHYTGFERTQDLRLAEKYAGVPGVPTVEQVEAFYDSELVIDLYKVLSEQLIWPTKSHSIKDLARWVRFCWRASQVGGDLSMVWYELATTHPDPEVRAENVAIGREYNEDDVAAQLALRDWVSSLGAARKPGEKIPAVESLRAPVPPRPQPVSMSA